MKRIVAITLLILFTLMLAGCAPAESAPRDGGYITGATLNTSAAGENEVTRYEVQPGKESLGVDFRSTFISGSAAFQVVAADGEIQFERRLTPGDSFFNETISLKPGIYRLVISWKEAVSGSYNIEWGAGTLEVPAIAWQAFIPGIGMLLAGLLFSIYGIRKGGWKYALLGAAFWAGTVIIKIVIATLVNTPLYKWMTAALPGLPGTLLFSVYVGLLTGITEVLITWLFLRYTKLGQTIWQKMLSFSLAFGGFEAILLGANTLVGVITVLTMSSQLPLSAIRQIAQLNNIVYGLAPIVERIFTIGVHLGCNLLLFYGVMRKESRWFWLSFALKSGIDAVAGYAQLSGQLSSVSFIWLIEVFVILFGLGGFAISRWLHGKITQLESENIRQAELTAEPGNE